VWNRLRTGLFSQTKAVYPGEEHMENKSERAHDIAEEGLDKLIEGDIEADEKLIDKAKQSESGRGIG
jgi:hypothetical protein